MFTWPKAAEPLVAAFSVAFTRPTFQRVTLLILGAILSLRQRTITGILRALGPLAKGHWSDFHRVLCCRVWSTWPLRDDEERDHAVDCNRHARLPRYQRNAPFDTTTLEPSDSC